MSGCIRARLKAMADATYAAFSLRLMPGMEPSRVIGVRMPLLRAMARELKGTAQAQAFMRDLPHAYYEEDNLHALLINEIGAYDAALEAIQAFLPHIDNWATCDSLRPKALGKNRAQLLGQCRAWMDSSHPFTVRFGMEMLMVHFLGEEFEPKALEWTAQIRSDHYYVRMMAAWLFAEAMAKHYEEAAAYIRSARLDAWTHNKAIQKARESFRVTQEHKKELLSLKR